ncbi:photosynthetic complex assembly protein PuhC [Croceicoccus sp. BE223]|uniref:photosynthetic complex assembly protein PuhC n=1 Tax=Croceicoccus sp. BE223 TaxID=2817716 RepID=UPI002858E859|nr:photosynthetic complex assembly protein PuhC [Croceicoccus sp. BE223]MDR7101560.1 putative photosynthetic complex assembly protein [Croceicoccus sp. BE223]
MSHAHDHANTVPGAALVAAAALVGFALAMTATVKLGWLDREAVPAVARAQADVAPVATRTLRFSDRADGSVLITDAATGAVVSTVPPGGEQGGFIRGVLRGLARERHMNGVGQVPPFRLTMWQDGSLTLIDEGTGRSVELGGFGSDNRAAFAALLPGRSGS